jgi:hypothetical protein
VGERFDDGLNKCAICLDTILLEETAELKGCEHQVRHVAQPPCSEHHILGYSATDCERATQTLSERIGAPTLLTLQDPILLTPWPWL